MDEESMDEAMKLLDDNEGIIVHGRPEQKCGVCTVNFTEVWIQPIQLHG